MTVPFPPLDPSEPHRAFATCREDPEPSLSDLLNDPTLQALMVRDGVDRASLERLITSTRRRLRFEARRPSAAGLFEAAVFAECRAA
jgi:hypothetical protein